MELKKCLGCMEDFEGYPCPHCGYDPGKAESGGYALPVQTILRGKYLVGRVLGQGGFGMTYIGWDIPLGRKVAIKEFYPSGQVSRTPGDRTITWYHTEQARQAQQGGMEMFLKEARKMAKVDSIPGVVKVRDLFQENGTAYIVMDFVEGETLKERLKKNGTMTWDRAKDIFLPAIHAMEQVHQRGLIHRDLSPSNLMLTPDGKVEILDLGAAKDLTSSNGASSMQVATGGFSPLEQYTQRGGSGTWTDVYAMAATIYYTLTGKVAPPAIDRLDKDTISWTLPGLDTMPGYALATLKKAMAVSAKDRIQTMAALEQGLADRVATPSAPAEVFSNVKNDTKSKRLWIIGAAAAVVLCVAIGGYIKLIKPADDYKKAQKLMEAGSYEEAAEAFQALGDYEDSAEMVTDAEAKAEEKRLKQQAYDKATAMMEAKRYPAAAVAFTALGDFEDSAQQAQIARTTIQPAAIAAGAFHSVGLHMDGTVVAAGYNDADQCEVGSWKNIVAVSAGKYHTVGLRSDGTVVAVGYSKDGDGNYAGQCNVGSWKNIVAIAAGDYHTIGLRSDGTVVAAGANGDGQCDVYGWTDIVAISAQNDFTLGLRIDGTVVAAGNNEDGKCDVDGWEDVAAVSAGGFHTAGLRLDGTVIAVGITDDERCNTFDWENITAIATGWSNTVGLCEDGTVVATGYNGDGRCDVQDWKDIVEIAATNSHTLGLRSDGTVAVTGNNKYGQCNVSGWKNIGFYQQ